VNLRFPDALWMGGQPRREASGGRIELIEPATEELLATVPAAGIAEVDEAVAAAAEAFRSSGWAAPSPKRRSEVLRDIAQRIRAQAEELALLEARNVGKPIEDARWEVSAGARCFDYYAHLAGQPGGETIPVAKEGLDYTLRVPMGVVAAIVPWNFPFLMAAWKVGPALAAGCTVVLKPASLTPLTALALGQIAQEAGIPPGVLSVLAGRGDQIGDHLVSHPQVRKIAFTGETVTGARILRLAADDIKRVSLELGGKSPNIIFADADLEAAAAAAPLAVFGNTGQDCCARSRVFVERAAYARFLEALVEATKKLVIGDPLDAKTQVGPLVSARQRERTERYVELAREEGGRVVYGGSRPTEKGYYLTPAIVDGLPNSSRVCREEIFGPLACVIPFEGEQEAIALANDTSYGLSGSLWTRDVERALRVGRALECGVLSVNTNSSVFQEAPFGGFKHSGLGRDLGVEAFRQYTELKNIFIRVPGWES
jgi:betaine-aldehyde dehydrogenase